MPDFRHSAAASTVTLGRASKMMAMTPRGTRRRPMMRPLGRVSILSTLPMGSGRAATCRTPSTMPATRSGVRVSRSSMAGRIPASLAAATSSALAASHSACRSVKMSAMAASAAFFLAVPAVASDVGGGLRRLCPAAAMLSYRHTFLEMKNFLE